MVVIFKGIVKLYYWTESHINSMPDKWNNFTRFSKIYSIYTEHVLIMFKRVYKCAGCALH